MALLRQKAAELFNGETDAAFGDSVYEAVLNDAKNFNSTEQSKINIRWKEVSSMSISSTPME